MDQPDQHLPAGRDDAGPSLLVVSRHAATGGRSKGLEAAWAHSAGIFLWALLSAFGLAIVLQSHPELADSLQLLAGIYLVWLGWQAWRSREQPVENGSTSAGAGHALADGAMVSILNPKVGLFFLAIFSPLLGAESSHGERVMAALLAATIDGLWYSAVTFLIDSATWSQRLRRSGRSLNVMMAAAFFSFALLALSTLAH